MLGSLNQVAYWDRPQPVVEFRGFFTGVGQRRPPHSPGCEAVAQPPTHGRSEMTYAAGR